MSAQANFAAEYYWLQGVTQSLDVGLVVLDLDYKVVLWNDFMDNHYCGDSPEVIGTEIFKLFPDMPADWFKQKFQGVLQFKGRGFSTWEQRPYLFKMRHYRPFTSAAEYMYQNITMMPLTDLAGKNSHIGVLIYDVTDVALQKMQLEKTRDEMSTLAKTDCLTGLYNRGYWEYCLKREFKRYNRTCQTPSMIVLDIDHFKKVNDTYGHPAGDEVIRTLGKLLQSSLRTTDIIGRLGGEEFGIILIDTTGEPAEMLANRIRERIAETVIEHDGHQIQITSSFGVCELTEDFADEQAWFATTDLGLYDSKHAGRNSVTRKYPT